MPKIIDNIDEKILELLATRNSISISELVQIFEYSLPVLRNICKNIATTYEFSYKRGVLSNIDDHQQTSNSEKKIIAYKAVSLINNDDTIFIGAGTTTFNMCKYLHKFKRLTVITNSIPILTELLKQPQIITICVGGVLQHQDQALVGEFSDIFIKNFHINKLFLGTEGIDASKGASRTIIQKNMAEHAISELNGQIYLLAESKKIGKMYTWLWLPTEKIYSIITDSKISKEQILKFKQQNINLEIVSDSIN